LLQQQNHQNKPQQNIDFFLQLPRQLSEGSSEFAGGRAEGNTGPQEEAGRHIVRSALRRSSRILFGHLSFFPLSLTCVLERVKVGATLPRLEGQATDLNARLQIAMRNNQNLMSRCQILGIFC
jgi:hypothetical protein